MLETLRGKMQAFYNAYNSVKKLVSDRGLPTQKYGDANRPETFATPTTFRESMYKAETKAQSQEAQDPDLQPLPAGFAAK